VGALAAVAAVIPAAAASPPSALEPAFKEGCRRLLTARVPGTKEAVLGEAGWVLLTSELKFASTGRFFGAEARLAYTRTKPEYADPIPAIVDFARQLADRGIGLVFMPVPVRPLVYPESVLGEAALPARQPPPYLFAEQAAFFAELSARGVQTIDLTPLFLAHRGDSRAPLFVPSESHWTGYGVYLAARAVAETVRGEPWLATAPHQEMTAEWLTLEHTGSIYRDLVSRGGLPARPPDHVHYRSVKLVTPEGPRSMARENLDSPVVVMGDSNTIWWRDRDASLAHQLAYELGFPVDVQATTGGGATNSRLNLIRTAQAHPGYLAKKKLVVWCFSSRATIEGSEGWRLTPIDPPPTPTPTPEPPGAPAATR